MRELTFNELPEAVQHINNKLDRIESLLTDQADRIGNPPDELFTIEDLSEYLHLAKASIYGLVCRREIPHEKRGKRLYFRKSSINLWLSEGKRKTKTEIQEEIKSKRG